MRAEDLLFDALSTAYWHELVSNLHVFPSQIVTDAQRALPKS